MFGTFTGYGDYFEDKNENESELSSRLPEIKKGDIVEVATLAAVPTLHNATNYDELAHLRILGNNRGNYVFKSFLGLVTHSDESKIRSTGVVDKKMMLEYDVEPRFLGDECIVLSEHHVRRIVKMQRGSFCSKCKEYNPEHEAQGEIYVCKSCTFNPYR